SVMTGNANALEVVFPGGPVSLLESVYEDSPQFKPANRIVQAIVQSLVERLPAERPLRILEIGAGTGGTSSFVLPILPAERTEYVYSDISSQFFSAAEQKFRDYPFIRYQTLDLERDPRQQDF